MAEPQFPTETPVRVKQAVRLASRFAEAEVVGTVEAWEKLPAGSRFAHDTGGRLHVQRLKLKKPDGEMTLLVVDDRTTITRAIDD